MFADSAISRYWEETFLLEVRGKLKGEKAKFSPLPVVNLYLSDVLYIVHSINGSSDGCQDVIK